MKNKILKKSVAFLLLVSMNMNIFAANLVLDPNSQHNTKLDTSANGTPIINISTPNNRGVSINEFLEYNVGHEGQVLNNADNLGRSHLAGLINANPNLGPNQAANLILLQVNGANRSQIEGYIEALSRDKVNVILSNENGIYLNGAGTINIRNFIPTTGRVKLKDGDVVGIDVEKGRVVIGANGFDATNTDYVNVIAKALEMQGNLVGNKVDVTLGENFVDNSGAVTSKGGINSVAIDASNLGSMYAGQVRIISTDKGAGVNSRALIYSKDEKLEITADGKINVAKIKGNGIEIKGSDYSQSEIASSDKDINITANTVKLAGQTQANGNISLNADVENDSEIFANGNLKTKDLTNSGKIQVSKTTQISGKLNNSGSVASVNKVTVTKDVKNTGEISTNDDFTAKNIVSSGKVSGKNIQVDNVSNNGKIIAASNFKAKKVKNTKEIAAVGKISTDDLETSGDVRSNGKITVNGNLENSGNVETGSDIAVSKDIKNSGKVLANGNLSGKNAENSGEVQAENISTDNVKNSGKINTKDFKSKNVTNTGKVLASGKISADDVDNGGKILTNGRLTAKNVKNSGKIASGDKISSKRLENSGTVATNSDISATDSLVNHNGGNIEGKNVEVKGFELRNAGKISAGNVKAKVNESTNSGQIHSSRDVDLDTQKLTNTGEILAVNDVNSANADVMNNGKIASNNKILLDNSKITNTGEILSGDISMQNAQKFDNTGTIKANNTVLTTTQDINLDGNLHGQQRLIISGRNITNNGNTTGTGLIQITSNDFTNNRDISSDTVIINGQGNIVNNAMITGDNGKISGNDITNNDLIAFEKYLEINAQNKVQNNKDKTIYGGQTLIIKGNEILNDEGEILGGNMDLNAGKIVNNVGTIQATGDILITSSDFQNVGRVSNLDKYEKYYETWDGIKLSENEVNNGWIYKTGKQMSKGKHSNDVLIPQRNWLEKLKNSNLINGYKSYLFTNHYDLIEEKIGEEGNHNDMKTGTVKFPKIALEGKMKSNATTEYGKVLANGNITINSGNVKNKDSIISGGGIVNINASSLENSVSLGNAVQLSNGREEVYVAFHRGHNKVSADTFFKRTLTDDKGNLLKGKIGYEAGQPSIIEGSVVNINAPVITSPITEANGKINNGSVTHGVAGSLFTNAIGKGISSTNGAVNVNLTNPNIQIVNNMSSVQAILNTGTISVNPLLTSAMFTQNMNPSSKYLLETRSKYVDLNKYYGSDYFLSRLGYTPSWNRVRRLGDAYYENQLITRALTEQLGTAFINGKSNEDLIKSLMDNAGMESSRLGLQVGKELTPEQISGLSKDLIWYVTQNVNGVEVLVPKIYLSKNTLNTITADGRNKIGGVNGTYIKTDNFVNDGTKWGNGGVTYVEANTVRNETTTNLLSEITGDRTYINSVGNIENIGGSINGQDLVSVVSQNGDVVNKTTTREIGYNNGEFDRSRYTEVASIGEISSNGNTYIEGKNYTSTGAVTSGNTVKINASENININALKLTGEQKFGRDEDNYGSYGFVNHLKSFVNGTDGVMMTSGKDTNISGSQVASFGNVNINAQNINITNVVNSESMESKHVNSGFLSTERKAKNSYVEDNQGSQIFGNNVLLNSKKDTNVIASDVMANKDKFGNGGNILVTAGNNVNILSDTTSQSSSSMTSKSKSIGSLNIGNKGRADGMAQIIQNSSHLSANGGNIVVKSGKDTLIGASELQSTESIGLVAGGNVVVTGLDEKYGESSSKYKGGMFRGGHLYKSNSESEMNQNITNKESVLKAGKDIVVKGENVGILGSDLDAGQDINVDAKNYIFMLSTVNSEHKHRTQTHTKRRWHGGKKTTTENWTEDNEYANNVDITTNGNILLNYHGAGAPADNKGIFAQGVNFNAKGQVLGLSEGDIYIQGTKDRLNSVYTSKTKKSFAGIGYKKSSDYVNTYQERYRLGQLYGDAGITYDADGKLRVEGVDVQSSGKTFFRGKMGTQFLPGIENGHRYEEHKSSGLTASLGLSWSGLSAGVGYQKSVDRIAETTKTIVPNKMNVAGEVVLETEKGNIDFYPTTGAVGKLVFNANGNEINILDMQNERTYDRQTQKSYVGIGANLGIPVVSSLQQVWEAGRGLRHARHKEEYLGSGLKTATGTAGLISSLGGNFVNSGLSLNYSNSRSSQHREESVSAGSNLYVANGVEYNGSNLHTRGLNIQNDGDTVYNLTGNIIKEAGVSTVKENSSSRGYGITISQDTFNSAGQVQNVLKPSTRIITPSISDEKSRTAGTYYNQGQDVTKGNSHYNVAGDVKITGVDVKTGSVSGTVGGKMTVESVQDKVDSESRGYSLSYGIGIGNHTVVRNGKPVQTNGVYTSSIGAGYSSGNATQRTTNTVAGFTADSGILDVKGTVKQTGSIIDGNFTLNSGGYEHEDLKDVDKSRNIGINMTFTPGVTEIYRNGRLTGEAAGGVAVGTRLNYSETDYVTKVKATIGEATGITVNGKSADLSSVNRDAGNMVEVEKDKKLRPAEYDLGTEYWATNYGREKFNNDVAQAKNKVERVSEIMKAVIENEDKNIGLYYRDRIDYEKTRDDLERAGLSDGFVLDETIAQMFAEIAAQQNIDDLQIISLNDPNIKEVVGADAIAGRAYHVGDGKVVIVAENLQDFADAMGTIAEEGRHIYHRNNNGLEDSEDYASFYGRQFERYFNKRAKDTPLYMIGSNLAYNAGQLGNDWENDIWIVHHPGGVGHVSIYDDVSGLIYSYGEPVPYAKEVYKQNNKMRGISLGFKENDVLQVSSLAGYLKSYKSKNFDVAMYKLVLSDRDRKIVEKNLKNSTIGMKEFKCVGSNCSNSGIKTAREDGKYYLRYSEPYNVLWRNCTVYVLSRFKGTSKEKDFKAIGILPSDLRDYAIDYYNYNRIDSEKKMINAIAQKEKNSNIAEITRKNRNSLHKITHSDKLVYYDFNGDGKRKEKNLKGLSSLEVKQYLEYMERSRGGKK